MQPVLFRQGRIYFVVDYDEIKNATADDYPLGLRSAPAGWNWRLPYEATTEVSLQPTRFTCMNCMDVSEPVTVIDGTQQFLFCLSCRPRWQEPTLELRLTHPYSATDLLTADELAGLEIALKRYSEELLRLRKHLPEGLPDPDSVDLENAMVQHPGLWEDLNMIVGAVRTARRQIYSYQHLLGERLLDRAIGTLPTLGQWDWDSFLESDRAFPEPITI